MLMLSIIALISFTNCKNEAPKKAEPATTTQKKETPKKEVADANVSVVSIEGNDAMQYNKKELKVKAGTKVKLTLKHVGKMDVAVMGHNLVILKQGVDVATFATAATKFKDNNYIPDNGKDVIAHTKMIGGGQSHTIEFDAPEPGSYDFICSFPAHYALMKGKFIVE